MPFEHLLAERHRLLLIMGHMHGRNRPKSAILRSGGLYVHFAAQPRASARNTTRAGCFKSTSTTLP